MANEHVEYSGGVDVPAKAIQVIDPAVVSKLPEGTVVTSITAHGASLWTRTARLDADIGGEKKQYFLKTSFGDRGRSMMSGEFRAMSMIFSVKPDLVPKPVAWGSYQTIPDVHFFLCHFHDIINELPDLRTFPAMLAELHRTETSSGGRFGFGNPTYHGNVPVEHGWSDTWEDYFIRTTRELLQLEQQAQGPNQELLELTEPFLEKVVPRLLRPLETGGRSIKACLIHGDLWHGNTGTDRKTGLPIIFDAASFYAHNEYDLGVWRAPWNNIGKSYVTAYHKHFPVSHPREDHDDRNAFMPQNPNSTRRRVNILDSILYVEDTGYRKRLMTEMKRLVNKFPDGYEGWAEPSSPSGP